jgi:hypothetical protein
MKDIIMMIAGILGAGLIYWIWWLAIQGLPNYVGVN